MKQTETDTPSSDPASPVTASPARMPDPETLCCLARITLTLNALLRQLGTVFDDLGDARIFCEILEANLRTRPGDTIRHLRPCNAFSVAQACDIPRETVRRRVNRLIEDGWLELHPAGGVICSGTALHALLGHHAKTFSQQLDCQGDTRSPAAAHCRNCSVKPSAATAGDHKYP